MQKELFVTSRLRRFADWLDELHLIRILQAIGSAGIIMAVFAFGIDLSDRTERSRRGM